VIVASDDGTRAILSELPPEMPYHAGHFGVIASCAALRDGQEWLAQALAVIDRNRHLLGELLKREMPEVGYVPPQASYLAWLDFRSLGLGPDPAQTFLERGRVALSSGPTFGAEGDGFARLNIGTSKGLLEEAVMRMKKACAGGTG